MKAKNVLIFGCSGQIGRSIVRKLTKDNYTVTAVTRNIHQKGIILKTLGNAGFINIVEANIFDEKKIRFQPLHCKFIVSFNCSSFRGN